jgi:hypothetical protein
LGTKFFSHRTPGRTGGESREPESGVEGRDRQQAVVLAALRRAGGAPVSYAELRQAGIELPASVVSELELAGAPIERCSGRGRGVVGVRLVPGSEAAAPAAAAVRERRERTERATPRAVKPASRVVVLAAFLAGLVLVSGVVAISSPGGGGHRRPAPIAKRSQARTAVAPSGPRPPRAVVSVHPPPAVPMSPTLGAELESEGHSLLDAGRYGEAVPVLKRAVLATGESVDACVQPANSTCLTYAYALYDLGRAERLSGEPQAAVPVLERRLRIDNQRSTVVAELQLARQGIS